jgi:hypothetical protein
MLLLFHDARHLGEASTMQWVEGSVMTWFGRTLRHGRRKAVFCVKNEVSERREASEAGERTPKK